MTNTTIYKTRYFMPSIKGFHHFKAFKFSFIGPIQT